ncbi:DUF3662 and FHA domain-containing protein [Microbacterium sp. NC79]|uniref:FhaA domain-containing protein n=1 Tax=Microbacterium sp. NC79 TaxID=2851009 RepID=UPI001C2C297D|nr:DUF3662 domain-containing protein [Microbacterium sp. NC79]
MGLLDSFEKGLERAVNGAFARTFRSGIQPVEIASALRRELDTQAAVVSRERILAPNTLDVYLNPADHKRMASLGSSLQDELLELVQAHARKQGYSFAGPVSINLHAHDSVATGTIRVESQTAKAADITWQAAVDINGRRYPLTKARTVIGRGSDSDIPVADAGTSRKHVEIVWDGERAMAVDLGSTNGSKINGQRFTKASLSAGQSILIGETTITFQVVPKSSRSARNEPEVSTRIFDAREYGA